MKLYDSHFDVVAIDNQKAALLGMDEFRDKPLYISSMHSMNNEVPIDSSVIIHFISFYLVN